MIIKESRIPDKIVNNHTTDGLKVLVMDEMMDRILPLFHKEIDRKRTQLAKNRSDLRKLKRGLGVLATELRTLKSNFNRENLIGEVLDKVESLNSRDILYGRTRESVFGLVSRLTEMTGNTLAEQLKLLNRLDQTVGKRVFS